MSVSMKSDRRPGRRASIYIVQLDVTKYYDEKKAYAKNTIVGDEVRDDRTIR